MEAKIIDDAGRREWERFVYQHPDTISWHVYDWHLVLQKYYDLQFFPIVACDGVRIHGVLPLYLVRTLRSGTGLVSIPYFVAGGIVADNLEAQRRILERALELSRQLDDAPITLKQYKVRVAGELATDRGYYNQELDLSVGMEAVWSGLDPVNRQQINKTWNEKLTLDFPSEDFNTFYRCLMRFQHASGVPCVSRRWIKLLLGSGLYSMALLRRHETVVAATMAKKFRDTVSFPLTSYASTTSNGIRYAYRLYWELLERLSTTCRIAHSGRIPADHRVPAFRLGWGGARHEYYYQYTKPLGRTETKSKRGRVRGTVQAVWKRLPDSCTNLLDPLIIKQFP